MAKQQYWHYRFDWTGQAYTRMQNFMRDETVFQNSSECFDAVTGCGWGHNQQP